MADAPTRSYDPDLIGGGFEDELARLEAQARLAWPQEAAILEHSGLGAARDVVEIGCGSGAHLERLSGAAPQATLSGVEPDDRLRALAAERVTRARLLEGTAEALPLADESVDFAVARYVFQHMTDPDRGAREALRVLRPGGRLATIEVDGELWGIAQPRFPEVQAAQEKAWRAQRRRAATA